MTKRLNTPIMTLLPELIKLPIDDVPKIQTTLAIIIGDNGERTISAVHGKLENHTINMSIDHPLYQLFIKEVGEDYYTGSAGPDNEILEIIETINNVEYVQYKRSRIDSIAIDRLCGYGDHAKPLFVYMPKNKNILSELTDEEYVIIHRELEYLIQKRMKFYSDYIDKHNIILR